MNESVPMPDAAEAAPTRFEQTLECLMDIHRSLADRAAGVPERQALEGLDAVLALVMPAGAKPRHIDMTGFAAFRASLETAAESSPEAHALRLFADALAQMKAMAGTFLEDSGTATAEPAEAEPPVVDAGEAPEAPVCEAPVSEAKATDTTVVADATPAEAVATYEANEDLSKADAEADADTDIEDGLDAAAGPDDGDEDDEDGIDLEDGDEDVVIDDEGDIETVEEADEPEAEPVEAAAESAAPEAAGMTGEVIDSEAEPGEAAAVPMEHVTREAIHETIDPETGEIQRRIAELEGELANARAQLAA